MEGVDLVDLEAGDRLLPQDQQLVTHAGPEDDDLPVEDVVHRNDHGWLARQGHGQPANRERGETPQAVLSRQLGE